MDIQSIDQGRRPQRVQNVVVACSAHVDTMRPAAARGILWHRRPRTWGPFWKPYSIGWSETEHPGMRAVFSTPGSEISPPGRADQNVCRVCSLQTWICRHCAVDDMSGKAPCVKARNAFFLERKLLLQNLKYFENYSFWKIIAFLTSKLTAECD